MPAFAANIDSSKKYGWSDVGGWVNFSPTNGGVNVNDSTLTGYAWAQNTGWIALDTTQSGVTNDGQGNLGGFAWSQAEGWLSFSGVTIDSDGYFHGSAVGASSTITFDCANCSVQTSWRRPASTGSFSSGGSWFLYDTYSGSTTVPSTVSVFLDSPIVQTVARIFSRKSDSANSGLRPPRSSAPTTSIVSTVGKSALVTNGQGVSSEVKEGSATSQESNKPLFKKVFLGFAGVVFLLVVFRFIVVFL
ncbi:MAG: hypothetical protein RIQ41_376 [Candidatus Parcubacteria bacterium]|jgi:hypothetical protein